MNSFIGCELRQRLCLCSTMPTTFHWIKRLELEFDGNWQHLSRPRNGDCCHTMTVYKIEKKTIFDWNEFLSMQWRWQPNKIKRLLQHLAILCRQMMATYKNYKRRMTNNYFELFVLLLHAWNFKLVWLLSAHRPRLNSAYAWLNE